MHEVAGIFFFLLTGLTRSNASPNLPDSKPAPEHFLIPRALNGVGNTTVPYHIYSRQESPICPAGSTECVGHCCVGKSCCAHGLVPCCLAGAVCQVFNQAPLCCVQGINCGTPSGTYTTPIIPSKTATSASITSNSGTSTTVTHVPTNSTTIASTIIQSGYSNTGTPTAVPPAAVNNDSDGKLALSDRIALGVGIAIGVPSTLCALIQMWRWTRKSD